MTPARGPRRPDTIFWVEPGAVLDDHLTLDEDESHHLLHVHRARPGAPFVAVDGAGVAYECLLESAARGVATGIIERRLGDMGEPPAPITLLVGLPDTGPAESVVEHTVPLGATTIDFFVAARSGRPALTGARMARLERIARSALKQSLRSRLPALRSSPTLEAAVAPLAGGPRFFGDPGGARGQATLSTSQDPGGDGTAQRHAILAVGPPGGFDESETEILKAAGFLPICLVSSRLTTETAAISLLAVARNILY